MDCKKIFKSILKVISVIAALAAIGGAVYLAVKKLTAKDEPEYFDDNDFFECDNEIEVVEVKDEEKKAEPVKKAAAKKKTAKKAEA